MLSAMCRAYVLDRALDGCWPLVVKTVRLTCGHLINQTARWSVIWIVFKTVFYYLHKTSSFLPVCWSESIYWFNVKFVSSLKFCSICQSSRLQLTVLVGCQEEHPACKNWVMGCWCGYLSGARCKVQIVCIWSSWCYCIPKRHNLIPHLNPDWFYLSGTSSPG